ncbi:MAG: putative dehydrogenase [Mariniblastus sp.]|jgi:predicted dehydrogenase
MKLSRRELIKSTAAASLATASMTTLAPSMVFGQSTRKDDTLRVAAIGFGGRGKADMNEMKSHKAFRLTAACDVDKSFFKIADEFGENVPKFQDYRTLFKDASDEFDAVLIATPDHMHSPIAMLAMEHDKHVYLQKPLAQDIAECRLLAKTAATKPNLKTQMGIQIHAHAAYRTAVAWIQNGLIGTVKDVHSWSGKGWGGEMKGKEATDAPENLDWDLYCGVSDKLDYVEGWFHRGNWRKWLAFGTGTQGDMGCHIVDPVFTALELKEPTKCTSLGPGPFKRNYALISHVVYEFKGTKYTSETVNMTWYNGSLRPTELNGIPKTVALPHQGSVFVGTKGSLMLPHIGEPMVFNVDGSVMEKLPEKLAHTNHFHDWIDAAIGQKEKAGAPFEYSGPLTEAVLMGTVINRWADQEFAWNASECRFEGDSEEVKIANALLAPKYRSGW